MIFKPELVKLIQRGAKTATRRRIKADETASRYKPGTSVAVQPGRGKAQVCRIHILQVEQQLVGDLTQRDAIAEGFKTRADFADYWMRLYDPAYFRLDERPDDDFLLDRFTARHANTPVWAIAFHLDTAHVPVLMHKHSERGYTDVPHNALRDEPEAIDASLLKHYTEDAAERRLREPGRREEHIRRRMKAMSERAKRLGAQGIQLPDEVLDTMDQLDQHLAVLERQRAA